MSDRPLIGLIRTVVHSQLQRTHIQTHTHTHTHTHIQTYTHKERERDRGGGGQTDSDPLSMCLQVLAFFFLLFSQRKRIGLQFCDFWSWVQLPVPHLHNILLTFRGNCIWIGWILCSCYLITFGCFLCDNKTFLPGYLTHAATKRPVSCRKECQHLKT